MALTGRGCVLLSGEQRNEYATRGYTVVRNVLTPEQAAAMKTRAARIVHEWDEDSASHVFSTNDNNRTGDDYFLDSGELVRCFYEEEAFGPDGRLVQDRSQSVNKIGHALHELDPVFTPLSHLAALGEIAAEIGMTEPQIRQSMYIFKQPRIGGVVNWHQDATFFYSEPISVVTFWFAIEDATTDNGCLWVEPGGHTGPLRERFNRTGSVTSMESLDATPWPTDGESIPLEAESGTLVCFQGALPHYSAPNRSNRSRQAYVLHVTDGTSTYADTNWLQAKKLPLRGFDS